LHDGKQRITVSTEPTTSASITEERLTMARRRLTESSATALWGFAVAAWVLTGTAPGVYVNDAPDAPILPVLLGLFVFAIGLAGIGLSGAAYLFYHARFARFRRSQGDDAVEAARYAASPPVSMLERHVRYAFIAGGFVFGFMAMVTVLMMISGSVESSHGTLLQGFARSSIIAAFAFLNARWIRERRRAGLVAASLLMLAATGTLIRAHVHGIVYYVAPVGTLLVLASWWRRFAYPPSRASS